MYRERRVGWKLSCAVACLGLGVAGLFFGSGIKAAGPKPKLSVPVLACDASTPASITLQVCAGATGAPAGFSLQWMTAADFAANGGWFTSEDPRLCKASFSGNASGSRYDLAANACVTIEVGDFLFDNGSSTNCANALSCGTSYVFHAFAHANSSTQKSDMTANLTCSTAACPATCYALSQGYWRNHLGDIVDPDGIPGNADDYLDYSDWPAAIVTAGGLQLGNNFYTLNQLNAILHATPAGGNQLVSLAHQVIAVEFSVSAYGWAPNSAEQQACLAAAHAAIGSLLIPPVGSGFVKGTLSSLIDCLDTEYIQAFHCGS